MRIGVLSDPPLRACEPAVHAGSVFEPEHLDRRTDAALEWWPRSGQLILAGDPVQFENPSDLEHIFARLAAANVAPLATVNGNHDLRPRRVRDCAVEHGIRLLYEEPPS